MDQFSKIDIEGRKKASSVLIRILSVLLALYIIFILSKSVWKNYQINKEIEAKEQKIAELQKEIEEMQNLIAYYQTDTFQELEARSKLNLKKPGETAIAVPKRQTQEENPAVAGTATATGSNEEESAPNYLKWWRFFTK
jgi:cell division protein FtsB